jgi:hypothetical protein
MNYEIVDDLLDSDTLEYIQTVMCNGDLKHHIHFPWFLSQNVATSNSDLDDMHCYFYHPFYWDNAPASEWYHEFIGQICSKMQIKSLMRVKGNLYPCTNDIFEHEPHIDMNFSHNGAIFYVNTNNGYTKLSDGTKIDSKENRLLLFDPSLPHNSSTCNDSKFRVNINFNYF